MGNILVLLMESISLDEAQSARSYSRPTLCRREGVGQQSEYLSDRAQGEANPWKKNGRRFKPDLVIWALQVGLALGPL